MRSSERRPSVTHAACSADSAASMAATGPASLSLGVRRLATPSMRHITTAQLASIWFCVLYFAGTFLYVGSRAAFGFFRLGSEYPEALVPREILMVIENMATQVFQLSALLVGFGTLLTGAVAVWITNNSEAIATH